MPKLYLNLVIAGPVGPGKILNLYLIFIKNLKDK